MNRVKELFEYIGLTDEYFYENNNLEEGQIVENNDLNEMVIEYINADPDDEDNPIYLNGLISYFKEYKEDSHVV